VPASSASLSPVAPARWRRSVPYVLPFGVLAVLLGGAALLGVSPLWAYPVRTSLVAAVILIWSRTVIQFRARHWAGSVLVGLAVFVVWIGPELLIPGYRSHWLLSNALTGSGGPSTVPLGVRDNATFLFFRVAGAALVVPVAEELFWRAWVMRRIMSVDFESVPLGSYSALAFWVTAIVFASEHGAYWDVGLVAGIAYNWWMVKTRSLADCILAHAVTNTALAIYVLCTGAWQYW